MDIKGKCRKHGELDNETGFLSRDAQAKTGWRLRCKQCCHENRVNYYYKNQEECIKKTGDWKKANRDRINEQVRLDRQLNPEKHKSWQQKHMEKEGELYPMKAAARRRKITLNYYQELIAKQNNKCAICDQEETRMHNGKLTRLCIDHCHSSGKVRGLLCHACNTAIGKFKDDISLLNNAILYLNSHN